MLIGYYMAVFISHPISTLNTHTIQRVEDPKAKMGVLVLIWIVI